MKNIKVSILTLFLSFSGFAALSMDPPDNDPNSRNITISCIKVEESGFDDNAQANVSTIDMVAMDIDALSEQLKIRTRERDLARNLAVIGQAQLRHIWNKNCWVKLDEAFCLDYTDIDEGIAACGYEGKVTREQIINQLNADPHHNSKSNPYLTILHRNRVSPK